MLSFGFYPVNGVATETPTDLLEISGEPIKQLMRDDERLAASMVGSLSMRLLELVERVEELSSASASVRLARFLTKLPGAGPPTRPTVELPVAKKDLAARLAHRARDALARAPEVGGPGADRLFPADARPAEPRKAALRSPTART